LGRKLRNRGEPAEKAKIFYRRKSHLSCSEEFLQINITIKTRRRESKEKSISNLYIAKNPNKNFPLNTKVFLFVVSCFLVSRDAAEAFSTLTAHQMGEGKLHLIKFSIC
jgi:hypothetical protein